MATRVQIFDEADCISFGTNTLARGMNPIVAPPAMVKFKACQFIWLGNQSRRRKL